LMSNSFKIADFAILPDYLLTILIICQPALELPSYI
jgi:hypothetical protein